MSLIDWGAALYTNTVWVKRGMAPKGWGQMKGEALYSAVKWADQALRWTYGGIHLEGLLLQRHQILDYLAEDKLRSGVSQVVEIGCGLSGRGLRLTQKYPHITYVESDLPAIIDEKARLAQKEKSSPASLKRVAINAVLKSGPLSLEEELRPFINPQRPVLVIMEGLANHLEGSDLRRVWENIHRFLSRGVGGVYLSDYLLAQQVLSRAPLRSFTQVVNQLMDNKFHFHLPSAEELRRTLLEVGFDAAYNYSPKEFYNILPIPQFKGGDLLTFVEAVKSPPLSPPIP